MIPTILVDARNCDELIPEIVELIENADIVGLDTETQDDNRHDGLMNIANMTRRPARNRRPPNWCSIFSGRL